MKLSDWPEVGSLIVKRHELVNQRDYGLIEIVIGGCMASAEIAEQVRPAVRLELRRQIEDVDRQLEALGVTVD